MIYSLFIGRFQPFHKGHQTIIDTELEKGNSVLIMCRDTGINDKNPFSYQERVKMIRKVYPDKRMVKIMKIPDIRGVYYGRGVGYEIKEIKVPKKIGNISATKIRKKYV